MPLIKNLLNMFDSKRFCRDCRRNVIREFKELKELKRMRKETRCTTLFCVADTAFQYEVSRDTVQADWHQTFSDAFGTYHHFEWAIGTGEGKSDIMEFENVGLRGRVQVNGLDLSGLNACYITLRACKIDKRINEFCVKAHALRGQQCVHCRLVVGDGFVTITRGESITRFFEHAEEAEEEEDDDSMDKDGNEFDGECSRPQKHAKSPELAREFLVDAATVIFKEQVEKAFREGTARQNAHSIFVCLALKLLEERVHVACKEIITLEKQMKLLEEEEKEKREEEERKERKRTKEREKKLRRKERLREKENREKKCANLNLDPVESDVLKEESTPSIDEGGEVTQSSLLSPDCQDGQDNQLLTEYTYLNMDNPSEDIPDVEFGNARDWNTSFSYDHLKYSRRKLKFHKDSQRDFNLKWSDRRKGPAFLENGVIVSKYESRYNADGSNGFNKPLRTNAAKFNLRYGSKSSEKFQCANYRIGDRYDPHSCSCNHHPDYRSRLEPHITRVARDSKYVNKVESLPDISKPYHRGNREINCRPKSKIISGNPPITKKVWEPLDSQKKCIRSNSDSDVTVRSTLKTEPSEPDQLAECCSTSSDEVTDISVQTNHDRDLTRLVAENGFHTIEKPQDSSMLSSSNSDNGSSCPSKGDSNVDSNPQNPESTTTSDSEESSQISDGKENPDRLENTASHGVVEEQSTLKEQDGKIQESAYVGTNSLSGRASSISIVAAQPQSLPPVHSRNINYPIFQAPTMGYYHQNPVPWQPGPMDGLMSFPHSSHYLYPSGFGYGLNGNASFVQYGSLQHLAAPPLINHAHGPVFQSLSQVNGVSIKEPTKAAYSIPKVPLTDRSETPTCVDDGRNGKADKTDMESNGFSLFHFGGPVALSTGFKADPVSLNEGIMQDEEKSSANCPDGDRPCGKKDSFEYNLFAAGNGIKFSIL